MKKKYEKPYCKVFVAETTDIITTSSEESLSDIVKSIASDATTKIYDFMDLFGT